jgi:hypothetical protein
MSLLDDENILMDNVKESVNNPFYVLNEYLRDFDIQGFRDADKNIIKNILSAIEIPEFRFYNYEWVIQSSEITLAVSKKYGDPDRRFIGDLITIRKIIKWWSDQNTPLLIHINRKLIEKFINEDKNTLIYFINDLEHKYKFEFNMVTLMSSLILD